MKISSWHPGKIAVVWVIALASYYFFYDVIDLSRAESRGGVFFMLVLAAVATWRWLSGREK